MNDRKVSAMLAEDIKGAQTLANGILMQFRSNNVTVMTMLLACTIVRRRLAEREALRQRQQYGKDTTPADILSISESVATEFLEEKD